MGASRWQIVRQLLIESLMLSTLGGLLGLALAAVGIHFFAFATQDVGKPYWVQFTMEYAVFGYFAGLCILSGLLFGLVPALRSSRVDLNTALKDGTRTAGTQRGGTLNGVLVVFQFALTLVLLTGAGIFVRSFLENQSLNRQVPADQLLTGRVTLPKERYAEVKKATEHLKALRRAGQNLYDSDEYLDDVYRFVAKEPLQWRRRNNNVCDSPNLYFAIAPNGNLKVCCDFETTGKYSVYDPEFPNWYRDGRIHEDAYSYTRSCSGCMYGSYPEITISARYIKAMIERFHYFNVRPPVLKKLSTQELREIAAQILWERTGEHLDPAVLPEKLVKLAS